MMSDLEAQDARDTSRLGWSCRRWDVAEEGHRHVTGCCGRGDVAEDLIMILSLAGTNNSAR